LRFVLLPLVALLIGLGVLQLGLRQLGYVLPFVGIVVGVALVGLCLYDAPTRPTEPSVGVVAPGTERRVAAGTWGLVLFGVLMPGGLVLVDGPAWISVIPLALVLALVTWRQAVAEKASIWDVAKRAWRR
jgi:hypothetical protein